MKTIKRQSDWEEDICQQILEVIHDELYFDYRYLDLALSSLQYKKDDTIQITATDGICFFYPIEQILRVYKENPVFLNRAYLHSVMHCVFRHLWMRKDREIFLWGLASDIAVEWLIDHAKGKSTNRILSRIRMNYYEHLKTDQIPVTAAAIYSDLLCITDPLQQMQLQKEFFVDDHRYWPKEEKSTSASNQASKNWEKVGRRLTQEIEKRGSENSDGGQNIIHQIKQGKSRRNYQDFLKKFMVLKEEMHCDEDTFDLTYYTYGLRLYKNMPLIEPLESREVMKILNFIIVIDTSYSTSGSLVEKFLEETFQILTSKDSFFHQSQIHIIQCDNQIRKDTLISSLDDISIYMEDFELSGGGGTDFRPAFRYINQQLDEGKYKNIKGVLYFTDGKGIYPAKRPPYDTAFVFLGQDSEMTVPAWAMKVFLDENEMI